MIVQSDEQKEAEIERRAQERIAAALHGMPEYMEQSVERAMRKVLSDAKLREEFWEQDRAAAFHRLVKEEQLDADKLKQVIDRYIYTGQEPLPDPDIIDLIQKPLGILERGPTRKRVLERVVDFVATFIRGVAA